MDQLPIGVDGVFKLDLEYRDDVGCDTYKVRSTQADCPVGVFETYPRLDRQTADLRLECCGGKLFVAQTSGLSASHL